LYDQIQLINTVLTMMGLASAMGFGLYFLRSWTRHRKEDLELRRQQAEADLKNRNVETAKRQAETEAIELEIHERRISVEAGLQLTDSGGFIVLNIHPDQRSAFLDLLKGFEDYARLRGYQCLFSFDSLSSNRVAFKFTVGEAGIGVSAQQVKTDFEDYIARIRDSGDLNDIPVSLTPEQHELVLVALKNRLSFLQHNYNLAKNANEFYERLLRQVPGTAFSQTPTVMVQTGGTLDSRTYSAHSSPQLVQGDANRDVAQSLDSSVHIADSFNDRRQQIESLEYLIKLLSEYPNAHAAVVNLEKVHDEVAGMAVPDRSRVWKWLERAKLSMETAKLSGEAIEAARKVYSSFNVASLLSALFG
jgi:hypothetical protein